MPKPTAPPRRISLNDFEVLSEEIVVHGPQYEQRTLVAEMRVIAHIRIGQQVYVCNEVISVPLHKDEEDADA